MTLPPAARERLADLLQPAKPYRRLERDGTTVPIGRRAWQLYRNPLRDALQQFAGLLPGPEADFNAVRVWALEVTAVRERIFSLLLALEPFAPFDKPAAEDLMQAIEDTIFSSANALREGVPGLGPTPQLRNSISWWSHRDSLHDDDEALAVAFRMPESPVDASGRFRADRVLQHYAYDNATLLARVMYHHLDSLGIPFVTDVLAGTSIIGGLLTCENPIGAYCAMDAFVTSYLAAPPEVAVQAATHLHAREAALQRARHLAARALTSAVEADDLETRALALAHIYKRTAEGPFRQYAWTLYCLRNGTWEPPPMLTSLGERLIAAGGFLAEIASGSVLPGMRNSEAHETLEWDGIAEEFVTEAGRIRLARVAIAVVEASSFATGCEAGMAAVRVLAIPPDHTFLPDPEEPGRMPAWLRARAYFGTNNLILTQEHLNARDAQLHLARLGPTDINPCFQALLIAHRLLPLIETFTVSIDDRPGTRITVSADALQATMPVGEYAVSALDRMPFSTFLPANTDARRRIEPDSVAIRAAAWIAVDDVLDAVDGSPANWDEIVLNVLDTRLHVVVMALDQVSQLIGPPGPRLESVFTSVSELRQWLALKRPANPRDAERCRALRRLRFQWDSWGPARRHPLVPETHTVDVPEPQPMIREQPAYKEFRAI
jgi:hypothetical protein